jgi:Rieske Fe-S protein
MIGIAAGAFAVSFALPAAALKALTLEKPVIAAGDVLTYASAKTGGQLGQPFKASDLPLNGAAQLFPMGKEANQDNLVHVIRIAQGDGVDGLVAYSAICTHLGCAVNEKLNRDKQILCPCHGSMYDPANHAVVRRGPSDRALPGLPIADGPNGAVIAAGVFDGPVGPQ